MAEGPMLAGVSKAEAFEAVRVRCEQLGATMVHCYDRHLAGLEFPLDSVMRWIKDADQVYWDGRPPSYGHELVIVLSTRAGAAVWVDVKHETALRNQRGTVYASSHAAQTSAAGMGGA